MDARKPSLAAFTLIESLIAILISQVVVGLIITVLSLMSSAMIPETPQIDVFAVQLRLLLARSARVEFSRDAMTFDYNNQQMTVFRDGSRLVKKPGYEILLEGVIQCDFTEESLTVCTEKECITVP